MSMPPVAPDNQQVRTGCKFIKDWLHILLTIDDLDDVFAD